MLIQYVQNERGGTDRIWALVPMSEIMIDQDTWYTSGLQGTGSKTLRIDTPVFVPNHMLVDVDKQQTPGMQIPGNILSRFTYMPFSTGLLAASVLGMSQGALDVFIKMSQTKVRMARPGVTEPVSGSPLVQSKIGMISAVIDSALTLLLSSTRAIEDKIRAGGALSVDENVTLRRNQGFAGRQAVSVVNDLFSQEGASSSNLSAPLQRFWRDVNTGAQHITLNWETISTSYGQHVFGLDAK
jgi:alkylation response protein AidB-like acyl-CoA dehydrogenase